MLDPMNPSLFISLLLFFSSLLLLPAYGQEGEEGGLEENQTNQSLDSVQDLDRVTGENILAAQVNAITVLNMIKNLQEEMKDVNQGIKDGNDKIELLEAEMLNQKNIQGKLPGKKSSEENEHELALDNDSQEPSKITKEEDIMENNINRLQIALRKLIDKSKVISKAIVEQRKLLQADILALKKLQRQYVRKHEEDKKKQQIQESTFQNDESETLMIIKELLDLERKVVILKDEAIAEKLEEKDRKKEGKKTVKIAAQVLNNPDDSLTDDEIDEILYPSGITEDELDILGLNDSSILALDDPSILNPETNFEDYEIIVDDYEIDEESKVPEDEVEYEVELDIYEYDDIPVVPKTPNLAPKKQFHGHFLQTDPYHHSPIYPFNTHSHPVHVNIYHNRPQHQRNPRPQEVPHHRIPLPPNTPHITLTGSLLEGLSKQIQGGLDRGPRVRIETILHQGQRNGRQRLGPRKSRKRKPKHEQRTRSFSDLVGGWGGS